MTSASRSSEVFQEGPDIKLANHILGHLGLSRELPFDMQTKEDQMMIGNRLELILGIVANGALVSLIDCTLNGSDVKELASIRGITSSSCSIDMNDSKWKHNVRCTIPEDKMNEVTHDNGPDNKQGMTILKNKELNYEVNSKCHCRSKNEDDSKTSLNIVNRTMDKCQFCGKILKDKKALRGHMREVHFATAAHSCPECGMTFVRKSTLKVRRWTTMFDQIGA